MFARFQSNDRSLVTASIRLSSAGPMAQQVGVPSATWVRPASWITCTGSPASLARSAMAKRSSSLTAFRTTFGWPSRSQARKSSVPRTASTAATAACAACAAILPRPMPRSDLTTRVSLVRMLATVLRRQRKQAAQNDLASAARRRDYGRLGPMTSSWDPVYLAAAPPPWDIGRAQPAFVRLAEAGRLTGRVLDVGCGTGEQTLMAAAHGAEAIGVDIARTAIERA